MKLTGALLRASIMVVKLITEFEFTNQLTYKELFFKYNCKFSCSFLYESLYRYKLETCSKIKKCLLFCSCTSLSIHLIDYLNFFGNSETRLCPLNTFSCQFCLLLPPLLFLLLFFYTHS